MKVRVDPSRCEGHNRCCAVHPEIFELNEEGKSVVRLDVIPDEWADRVRYAIANCPERAISQE